MTTRCMILLWETADYNATRATDRVMKVSHLLCSHLNTETDENRPGLTPTLGGQMLGGDVTVCGFP